MTVQIVSYDLRAPGRNYQNLYDAIKKYPWAKPLESVWLIDTEKTSGQIRDELGTHIDSNDQLAVFELTADAGWATRRIDSAVTDWIKKRRP